MRKIVTLLSLLSLAAAFQPYSARAAALTVDTTDDSGPGSLRQAILDANASAGADTITFTIGPADTVTLLSALPVVANAGTVTMHGNGATVSGDDAVRVFAVGVGAQLTLNDLIVTNGYAEDDGGAIVSHGTLSLDGVTVSESVSEGSGGAIYSTSAISLTDSLISGNSALNGGGIFSEAGVGLVNTVVTNNTASGDGGGLYALMTSGLSEGSVVSGNSAQGSGGGVYLNGPFLGVVDSTISGNTAQDGGGIYAIITASHTDGLSMTNAIVADNTATGSGGGIYRAAATTFTSATLTDSTVSGNAAADGGGIYASAGIDIIGGSVADNTATGDGGGIRGTSVTLDAATVSNNAANNGGGLWGTSVTLFGATVSGNNASARGGGLYNATSGVLWVKQGSAVSGNLAFGTSGLDGGGGIYSAGTLLIEDSAVAGNSGYFGGGIYQYGFNLSTTLDGAAVTGNTAAGALYGGAGGGIYNMNSTLSITDSDISDNDAGSGGGIVTEWAAVTLTNSTVTGNSAEDNDPSPGLPNFGGGILNNSGGRAMTIAGSTIADNTTETGGGGLYFNSGAGTLTITGTTFAGNTATRPDGIGGALAMAGGTMTMTGSAVVGSQAGEGGGLYLSNSAVTLTNTTISGNAAMGGGPDIGIGGGIHVLGNTLTLNNVTLADNTADGSGHGISSNGSSLTLNNSILDNAGGDCHLASGTVVANHTIFGSAQTCGVAAGGGTLIDVDPMLGALTGSPAYHPLPSNSPAVDSGSNALVPDGIATDQAGGPRIVNDTVDRGAYEFPLVNLIANGGFETAGAPPGKAASWKGSGLTAKDSRKCDKPTKVFAAAGQCAFRLKGKAASPSRSIAQKIVFPAAGAPGETYLFDARVRAKSLAAGALIRVKVKYVSGLVAKAEVPLTYGSYEYLPVHAELPIADLVRFVKVSIRTGAGKGQLLIDDVWLTSGEPTRLPARGEGPPPAAPDGFRRAGG